MNALIVALLAVVVAMATAQTPAPCLSPPQFQARATYYNVSTRELDRMLYTYDSTNRRISVYEDFVGHVPGKSYYHEIYLHDENVVYRQNLKSLKCEKFAIREPWRHLGIPPNATFEDEFTVGGPGEYFIGQEWSDRLPARKHAEWFGMFTLKNCYLVTETLIEMETATDFTTATQTFYDIVEGIPNPNIFIPAPECEQQAVTGTLKKWKYKFL